MTDIERVVEQLELVVGLTEGQVPGPDLEAAAVEARRVRERVGYLGSTLVVALLGGTGVGKSSLLNAIAGERVASTGLLRPHTRSPLAWIPHRAEPSLRPLLDGLGIADVVEHRSLPGIAVLDMHDLDSVEEGHRSTVERMLPAVDVALWVVDPVKYADAAFHAEFIAPSASQVDRLLFVMNRIDTVTEAAREGLVGEFVALLRADGVPAPVVFATTADPPDGDSAGVRPLVDHLRNRLDEKRVRLSRLVADARRIGRVVAELADVGGGSSTGLDAGWEAWCSRARRAAEDGMGMVAREELLLDLEALVAEVSAACGPVLGARLRRRFPPTAVEEALEAGLAAAAGEPDGSDFDGDRLVATVLERLGSPLRDIVWARAALAAAIAGLAVEATQAEARLEGGASSG